MLRSPSMLIQGISTLVDSTREIVRMAMWILDCCRVRVAMWILDCRHVRVSVCHGPCVSGSGYGCLILDHPGWFNNPEENEGATHADTESLSKLCRLYQQGVSCGTYFRLSRAGQILIRSHLERCPTDIPPAVFRTGLSL